MNPKKKRKNRILKSLLAISVVGCFLSGLALDSDSWIPIVVCGICATYLLIFTLANVPR